MRLKINGLFLAMLFLLVACADVQTRRDGRTPTVPPREDSGGFGDSGNEPPPPVSRSEEKKVALILGPGGYKTFAHAGVIKELKKANIPVHKVVGLEWGALVAGLFAQRGQIHEAEWKLYKLEKLDLNKTGFFSSKREAQSLKNLEGFIKENIENRDTSQLAVPFLCPSLALNSGTLEWQDQGSLQKAVLNCIGFPPLFTPYGNSVAGLFSLDDAISRLRREGYNVIVLVNVLGEGPLFDKNDLKDDYASAILWSEARRGLWRAKSLVSDVVEVSTRGIKISDFESRRLLVTAGEAAGEKAAETLASKYGF